MSASRAPECHELLALRQGVHSTRLPSGETRLLAWPHAESFGPLDDAQERALRCLAAQPWSGAELAATARTSTTGTTADGQAQASAAAEAVPRLLDQLRAGGWLDVTVTCADRPLYTLKPRRPPPPPEAPGGDLVLSRLAVLRRAGDGIVLESPRAWCDLWVHDPAALVVLGGLSSPGGATPPGHLPAGAAERLLRDLRWAGLAVPAAGAEDTEFRVRQWSPDALRFHEHSRLGYRGLIGYGGTYWAEGEFDPLPARRDPYPGAAVELHRPDADRLRRTDPTLTSVLEDRRSLREHDAEAPITLEQLGEFLYRCARTRRTFTRDGVEYVSRPYPAGGSAYELELYPVVAQADGLEPGMYHYDSYDHRLRLVQQAPHPAVRRLLRIAERGYQSATPQVLLVIAARVGRVMWKYEAMVYALVLKHVGVLYQTMYSVATAMGLAPCALGGGDAVAFSQATGADPLVECSVGEFVLGSRAPDPPSPRDQPRPAAAPRPDAPAGGIGDAG